jgi:preprotein translocase subunit SecE
MFNKVKKFFIDAYQEMHKVAWPSKQELTGSTIVVVVMSVIVSIFIGIVDLILNKLVNLLMTVASS